MALTAKTIVVTVKIILVTIKIIVVTVKNRYDSKILVDNESFYQ